MVAIKVVAGDAVLGRQLSSPVSSATVTVSSTPSVSVSATTVTVNPMSEIWASWSGSHPPFPFFTGTLTASGGSSTPSTTATSNTDTSTAAIAASTGDSSAASAPGSAVSHHRLSSEAIGGLVAGLVLLVVIIIAAFFVARRYRDRRMEKSVVPGAFGGKKGRGSVSSDASITSFDTHTEVPGTPAPRFRPQSSIPEIPELPGSSWHHLTAPSARESVVMGFPEAMVALGSGALQSDSAYQRVKQPEMKQTNKNLRPLVLPSLTGLFAQSRQSAKDRSYLPMHGQQASSHSPVSLNRSRSKTVLSHDFHTLSPITDQTSNPSALSESLSNSPTADGASGKRRKTLSQSLIPKLPFSADFPGLSSMSLPSIFSPISPSSKKSNNISPLSTRSNKSPLKSRISRPLPLSPPISSPSDSSFMQPRPPSIQSWSRYELPATAFGISIPMSVDDADRAKSGTVRDDSDMKKVYSEFHNADEDTTAPYDLVQVGTPKLGDIVSDTLDGETYVRVRPASHDTETFSMFEETQPARPSLQVNTRFSRHGHTQNTSSESKHRSTERYSSSSLSVPHPPTAPFTQYRRNDSAHSIATHRSTSPLIRAGSRQTAQITPAHPHTVPAHQATLVAPPSPDPLPDLEPACEGQTEFDTASESSLETRLDPPLPNPTHDFALTATVHDGHVESQSEAPSLYGSPKLDSVDPADSVVPIVLKFHCPLKKRRYRQGYQVPQGMTWRILDKRQLERRSALECGMGDGDADGETNPKDTSDGPGRDGVHEMPAE